MSMSTTLHTLLDAWHRRTSPIVSQLRLAWQQRSRREQALLLGAALLLSAVLLWVVGLRPALNTIEQANLQLPKLQAGSAQLDAIILEAKALSRGRQGVLSVSETEEALKTALHDTGLDAVSTLSRLLETAQDQVLWEISLANAPSAHVMTWLAGLPFIAQVQTQQLDLTRSTVDGRERPGQLSGKVVVALATKETS